MAEYKKIVDSKGTVRYYDVSKNQFAKSDSVPEEVKSALESAEDNIVVNEKSEAIDEGPEPEATVEEVKGTKTAKASEKELAEHTRPENTKPVAEEVEDPEEAEAEVVDEDDGIDEEVAPSRPAPTQEVGMGFPRKKGKTVDVFDGKTPHTHVRYVAGFTVPVTAENYNNKSTQEIIDRLKELGKL